MTRMYGRIIAALLATGAIVRAGAPAQAHTVAERFRPTKQGVELVYRISYHVMGLKLLGIGEARSFAVQGEWIDDNGQTTPAYYSEVRFDTHDDVEKGGRGRISIHNHMVAVLSDPGLTTLVYFKNADEYLNPFFQNPRHEYYLDYYAVKDGGIDYFKEDHRTGERTYELDNAEGLLQQGNAIAATLQRMSGVYRGSEEPLTHESDFRVYFNVNGKVQPFAAESAEEHLKVAPLDARMDALRVDISLAPEAKGRAGELSLWGVPFGDLAEKSEDAKLIELANGSPDWSMIPLRMNYSRPIGYIRCNLVGIAVRIHQP